MNYHHFTIEECSCLREYFIQGKSYRQIAKLLGRNVSSVSREINRNRTHQYDIPTYYPHTAQRKCNLRRSFCHRGMFWNQEVINYINEKLNLTWSPEQISKTPCDLKLPSFKTIIVGYMKDILLVEMLKSILCMAKRNKRKLKWTFERILRAEISQE